MNKHKNKIFVSKRSEDGSYKPYLEIDINDEPVELTYNPSPNKPKMNKLKFMIGAILIAFLLTTIALLC